MNDRQVLARFESRLTALDTQLRPPRPWLGRGGILKRGQDRDLGVLRTSASALLAVFVIGALVMVSLSSGVGHTASPTSAPSPAAVVTASEAPFPAWFREAGPWKSTGLVDLPTAPDRHPTLGALVAHLETFFEAGVKVPRPAAGVTIQVPDGAATAREVHLFATVIGGATDASAGLQFRIIAFHDERGWWFDENAQSRIYCDLPLQPRGQCLGSSEPVRGQ